MSQGGETLLHRNLAVLSVASPEVLEELRAAVPLEDFVLGALSSTELAIDPRRLPELVARLDARGLGPLLKRAKATQAG